MVTDDFDDWACWLTEQEEWEEWQQEERAFHPKYLLIMVMCVLLWVLVVVGAVTLYQR
jgi:uncharacterized membrane-anchored protein